MAEALAGAASAAVDVPLAAVEAAAVVAATAAANVATAAKIGASLLGIEPPPAASGEPENDADTEGAKPDST